MSSWHKRPRHSFQPELNLRRIRLHRVGFRWLCRQSEINNRILFQIWQWSISWMSKLQECTTTSTTEAEYVVASDATKEALWLSQLAHTFRLQLSTATVRVLSLCRKIRFTTTPPSISTVDITSFGTASFQGKSASRRYLQPIMSQME